MVDAAMQLRSAHARYAARAAASLGLSFRSLDGDDAYLFEIADGAKRVYFRGGAGSPYAQNSARAAAIAKDKAFTAAVLEAAKLPVIPGQMFFVTERYTDKRGPGREPSDLAAFAATSTYPVFCKPIDASSGAYAEAIWDHAGMLDYMSRVARDHYAILVQPCLRGAEYRVFVLEGRVLFAYRKAPPDFVGDGVSTLAEIASNIMRRGPEAPLPRFRGADGASANSSDIAVQGAHYTIEGPANRSVGGGAMAPFEKVPHALAELALGASNVIGLRVSGVDIFDLSPAGDFSDLCVIEVNSNPMIRTLEDHDRWDLILTIWRANIAAAFA